MTPNPVTTEHVQAAANSADLAGSRGELAQLAMAAINQGSSALDSERASHRDTTAQLASKTAQLAAEVAAHVATQTALTAATTKLANLETALKAAGVAVTAAEK
jgi:hypothetical protein